MILHQPLATDRMKARRWSRHLQHRPLIRVNRLNPKRGMKFPRPMNKILEIQGNTLVHLERLPQKVKVRQVLRLVRLVVSRWSIVKGKEQSFQWPMEQALFVKMVFLSPTQAQVKLH